MQRTIETFTALSVERVSKPGVYADRGRDRARGLYLQVTAGSDGKVRRSWLFRFSLGGKSRWMGLGPLETTGLSEARIKARKARELRDEGIDPIDAKKARLSETALAAAKSITFDACADAVVKAHGDGWKNPKHRTQWRNSLSNYVGPVFGRLPVQAVDVGLVMKVLEPIWATKPETAKRVRGRIEKVLDWAKVAGYRQGENPARWKSNLDQLLLNRSRTHKVQHHPALPYTELPAFMKDLRSRQTTGARALEFLILTAARSGEALGARWEEINWQERCWVVPAERMKGDLTHRVPLPNAAIALLEELQKAPGRMESSSSLAFKAAVRAR